MGKGSIIAHLGAGQYSVTLNQERARVTAAIALLTAQIATMETTLAGMAAGHDKDLLRLEITSLEKKKEQLEAHTTDPAVTAWCADLTIDLSGEVATVEIPGERGTVQIRPGYAGRSAYAAARDGQLQEAIASTPAGVFYNWAMLPGWQKWKPTARHGVISDIDTINDLCTVTLEAATSSAQGLNVNQAAVLYNVPVEYMECNATAFENGDSVLVAFTDQDWAQPKVIGFKDNPKSCNGGGYVVVKLYGSGWAEPYRYWVWDLTTSALAVMTDAEGDPITQPCEEAEFTGFMTRQSVSFLTENPTFGKSLEIATETYPTPETAPVVSDVLGMDGLAYNNDYDYTNAAVYSKNVHNHYKMGRHISLLQSGETSCFVFDFAQASTYQLSGYHDMGGGWICNTHAVQTITDSYQVQTPLGITHSFDTIKLYKVQDRADCGDWSITEQTTEYVCEAQTSLNLGAGANGYMQFYFVKWYTVDSETGEWTFHWHAAVAARNAPNVDPATMDRADYIAGGRNDALESFITAAIADYISDNGHDLESGTKADISDTLFDGFSIVLDAYGEDFA